MPYIIGIDAGSKTIKLVVADAAGKIVHSVYRRHRADIKATLTEVLHDISWRYGEIVGTVGVTGSAGIALAKALDLPFYQEVVATTRAVKSAYPQADAVIELGGEDAKVIYLSGGLEQRMNATCAGGTGGFIDTIAFMIGSHSAHMSSLSLGASRTYPIASRCAVFAQNDVRPLLNAGAKPADIAASALDAVVRQTLGGLACGRPIEGTVVFLGGPLEHIPDLVRRFRIALGLTPKTGIKPKDAHLFTALGAALLGSEEGGKVASLVDLEREVRAMDIPEDDLPRLEPLFADGEEVAAFRDRHGACQFERARLFDARGALYVGLDAGSTAVKIAVLDEEGRLVYSDSRPTGGDVLATASGMVDSFWSATPKDIRKNPYVHVARAAVTGYGEAILKAGLKFDSGVVETLAHVRAARALQPDLTFLLDIGGQDMKAIWVRDGRVTNAVLNEACSSGCGSFIEGTAYSLRSTPYRFAEAAMESTSPVDLGMKCTVFMTSRVRHAQKAGVPLADIAAGISYSVVKNALFRIIGMDRLDSLGNRVVVQGGAFANDSVLRAFEKVSGLEVLRPKEAHLMGAIGAALTARMQAGALSDARSALASGAEIAAMKPRRVSAQCPGCENRCSVSVVDFGDGRSFVSGGRCERAAALLGENVQPNALAADGSSASSFERAGRRKAPNAVAVEQRLLSRLRSMENTGPRASAYLGVMNVLSQYETLPFWHALACRLGFSVIVPDDARGKFVDSRREGMKTVPSESVCFPAKLAHARLFDMEHAGAEGVLMPRYERYGRCSVTCDYAAALSDAVPSVREGRLLMVSPVLSDMRPTRIAGNEDDLFSLLAVLCEFAEHVGVPAVSMAELKEAVGWALAAQDEFERTVAQANDRALAWLNAAPGRRGAVLAGRPYHADPALLHGIDGVLTDLGFAVLSPLGLAADARAGDADEDASGEGGECRDYPERGESLTGGLAAPSWKPARRLERLARFAAEHSRLELVCLQSFGCSYDALSLLSVRDILESEGRPFTALKIDDMADTAHLRIRLRTLAETLDAESLLGLTRESTIEGLSCTRDCADGSKAGEMLVDVSGYVEACDIEEAQASVPSDVCFVASALMGRAIRLAKRDVCVSDSPSLRDGDEGHFPKRAAKGAVRVRVPRVCERCLLDALPQVVSRATGCSIEVDWVDADASGFAANGRAGGGPKECDAEGCKPRIGIVGCALLCFDPLMNDRVIEFVESQGCEAVPPRVDGLFVDDVRYLDELSRFYDMGVDHVIYLQSFGCLKGHVRSRGALHELARLFPGMPVTVIDYDPEASALNRENRIRLALAAAKEAASSRCQE